MRVSAKVEPNPVVVHASDVGGHDTVACDGVFPLAHRPYRRVLCGVSRGGLKVRESQSLSERMESRREARIVSLESTDQSQYASVFWAEIRPKFWNYEVERGRRQMVEGNPKI